MFLKSNNTYFDYINSLKTSLRDENNLYLIFLYSAIPQILAEVTSIFYFQEYLNKDSSSFQVMCIYKPILVSGPKISAIGHDTGPKPKTWFHKNLIKVNQTSCLRWFHWITIMYSILVAIKDGVYIIVQLQYTF